MYLVPIWRIILYTLQAYGFFRYFYLIFLFFNYRRLRARSLSEATACETFLLQCTSYISFLYIYNTRLILSRARGIELKPSKSSRTVYNLFRITRQRRIHSAVFFIHIHAVAEETGEGPTHHPGTATWRARHPAAERQPRLQPKRFRLRRSTYAYNYNYYYYYWERLVPGSGGGLICECGDVKKWLQKHDADTSNLILRGIERRSSK